MSPSGRAGPVTGTNFALGSYDRKFQPRFRDEKRPNILASGAKFEKESKESKYGEKKNHDFRACHSMAVSLQLNGMLTMWKRQQAMQDDAIRSARVHPAFNLCNRAEVFVR